MSLTAEEKTILISKAMADPVFFCQTFLADLFPRPVPWVHRGLLAILTRRTKFLLKYGELDKIVSNFVYTGENDEVRQIFHVYERGISGADSAKIPVGDQSAQPKLTIKLRLGQNTLVMMPRGSSKTTIAGIAVPLMKILFQDDIFTLYLSQSQKHAEAQIETIKRQLSSNPLILECFGDLRPSRAEDERWSAAKFETRNGVAMAARGKGGQIRGVNHNGQRPSTMIVDDPQDRADCISEVQREKDLAWAYAEFKPAAAQLKGKEGSIVALGTLVHPLCVINTWAKDPTWTVVKLGAFDKQGDPIWDDYMDKEKYEKEKQSYSRAGLLHLFHLEYDNLEVSIEDQIFTRDMFIYEPPPDDLIVCATYCDPAISEKRTADFTAIVTVGMNSKGLIWVLDCWMNRTRNEEDKALEFIRQHKHWKSRFGAYESNAYQAAFGNTIHEMMFRTKHYFELTPKTHKSNKISRIRAALRPRFAAGYMRLAKKWPELELQLEELRSDGSHLHDDGPDAVAAAITLLDPAAAVAAGEDVRKDIYPPIEDSLGAWWEEAS